MDLGKNNVPPENFPYELDEEGQIVDSESPAGIRLRYERLRKRVVENRWNHRQEEREAQKAAKAVLAANTLKKDKWFCESYLKRLNTTLDCNSYYHWRENRTIAGEDAA